MKARLWPRLQPWLLPLGALVTFWGYVSPWVNHRVAGLVILGLDLGEYVKFLPEVRSGQLALWREGFYLPVLAVSLTCSLAAFRREPGYGWLARVPLLALAIVAALNLLPPAWTPARLLTPEFRLQAAWLGLCLLALAFSPFLALLPARLAAGLIALFSLGSLVAVLQFLRVLPAIAALYRHALLPGWGLYVLLAGLLLLLAGAAGLWQLAHPPIPPHNRPVKEGAA